MAHAIGTVTYNVFIGKDRLIPNVEIKPQKGGTVKLIGARAHQRWEIPKASITRKVKL